MTMVCYEREYKKWTDATKEFKEKCKHLENYGLILDMLESAVKFLENKKNE